MWQQSRSLLPWSVAWEAQATGAKLGVAEIGVDSSFYPSPTRPSCSQLERVIRQERAAFWASARSLMSAAAELFPALQGRAKAFKLAVHRIHGESRQGDVTPQPSGM